MLYDLTIFSLIAIGLGMWMLNYLDIKLVTQRHRSIRNIIGFILFLLGMILLATEKQFFIMAGIWGLIGVFCMFINYLDCPTKEQTKEVFNNYYGLILIMVSAMGFLCVFLGINIH